MHKNLNKNNIHEVSKASNWIKNNLKDYGKYLDLYWNIKTKIDKKIANKKINQINNTIITSLLIIKSAINRKEHRGSHYRSDFPETNPLLKNRSRITIKDIT